MMIDGINEIVDFFRSSMPYSIIYFLPLLLIVTNQQALVNGAQEFQVYRMQQYDMPHGSHFGSRQNLLNMEARTVSQLSSPSSASSSISRRCVLIKLNDFNLELYRLLVGQYVGAILIVLPLRYDHTNRSQIKQFELQLLREEVKIPVYFILESEEVLSYYDYIASSSHDSNQQSKQNAFKALMDSVITDGFQFVINSPQSQPIVQSNSEYQAVNLQAKLNGLNSQEAQSDSNRNKKIPTVVVTAHYDSFGMATSLSYGCDSNGSGVVALLELSRILSKLYSKNKTIPPLNIIFLLTAEGKFNYHGIKKWIEEQSETNEMAGKIDLDEVQLAICLDSLGKQASSSDESSLYMHVSRPPKEGTASYEFQKYLEISANKSNVKFEMNHKKINLANDLLAWEHERFSLNKIPAFSLSHFQSYKDADRTSMTDTIDQVDKNVLKTNIKVILRAMLQFMYKKENIDEDLLIDDLEVSDEFIQSWLEKVCSVSRTASILNKNHPLVGNMFAHFTHHLQESVKFPVRVQSKEPEFVFYNENQATLIINSVKPAVFDFFLAILITGYIGLVYLFVVNFNKVAALTLNNKLLISSISTSNGNGVANGNGKSKAY